MDELPVTVPTQEPDQPITVPADVRPSIPLPPDIARLRADKAYLGLGGDKVDIHNKIASGQEQILREAAASSLNFDAAMKREQAIVDAYRQKGSPLSYQEALHVVDPFNPDNQPANPVDVIERAYSTKFVSSLNTAAGYMKDTFLDKAKQEIPEETTNKERVGTELTTKLEFARTLKQNLETEVAGQTWPSWLADQAKTLFQPYVEYKMRGLNPSVGKITGGVLLGDNMKAQADELFSRPTPDFIKGVSEIVQSLRKDNPSLTSEFLDYIIGNSENERKLQNIFTIISPVDYASLAGTSKALLRKISLNNRAGTAFKQMAQEAAKADGSVPLKAVMEEAAGDVHSAGVTRAADEIVKTLDGTLEPIQDAKSKLTSNFRLDGDLLDSNPGKLTTQELTLLKDGFYKSGSDLYDVITQALKLNRTPTPLAAEEALKAYQAEARKGLRGLDNAILDIGSPLKSAETNTYHIPFTFGNEYGRLFSDPETALNWAKRNGFAEPRIMSAEGTVEKEAGKLVGTATDLRNKARLEKSVPVTELFLQRTKNFLSRKFVGPRTPESIAKAKEELVSTKQILDDYKKQLADINSRVVTSDPIIEQHGVGYKVVVIRPYKETDDVVRSWLTNEAASKSSASLEGFASWKNSFLGWIRGADDTLAFNETLNRKIATYTQSLLRQWAKADAEAIEKIANQFKWTRPRTWYGALSGGNKQMFKEWNETVKFAKTIDDPKTGEKGYFFKTPGELEDHYQRYYQRLPTFPEVQAYFSHVKLVEGNRVLSEIAEFRNRARLGAEQHQIFTLGKDGTRVASGYFDGVQEKEFPGGRGQILVVGERKGEERLYNLGANDIPGKDIQRFREWVETGKAKLVRVYDPDAHPLKDFSDTAGSNRIRYVLSVDAETKPLDLNHVNRRGGGHFDIDSDFYVKQASLVDETPGNVSTDKRNLYAKIYTGDNTLMPIGNRVMGRDVAQKMTKMNELMRTNDIEGAKALSRQLGIDWDIMESWYKPSIHPITKKVSPPRIDVNEPFYLVPRNKKIFDIDKTLEKRIGERFQDGTRSGSDAQQFQVAYTQARDSDEMFTIKDVGTRNNPIYKHVPAEYVDPIPTMNRALSRAINSTFMDDYKISAVEHWLQEAIPYLKASETEVRSAPFWHFNNADKGAFKSAAEFGGEQDHTGVIQNLLSNRYKINQFVGMPNKVETTLHSLTQLLVDKFYQKFGPEESQGPLARAFTVIPLWALAKTTDPVGAIRSFAFNAKLGVFSIPQFFVQAQTFTNIIGLSPRAGMAGTYATMLHTWSRINSHPMILVAMDEYASKLNMFGSKWRTGEWLEARRELGKTGFEHVGGEYQLADDQMTHKFIKNQWNNFLDAGQVFFREGEKASRIGAYYTAFREFRDVNPTKVLTDADRAKILNRADLLTNNMSRASASSLNHSLLSLPTQFLSYQVRMAELFFGKRIGETTAERVKARTMLISMYSAMYGIPSAIGITGYPFGDSLRQYAINKGYVIGDNQIADVLMNGIPTWQLAMISGGLDYQKGNQYNVGDRYGSQGFTQLRESLRSDKTAWAIFGGAGASTLVNTIASLDPFWQAAKYMVGDDEEGNTFKVTPMHFVNLFSEVASADAAKRAFYAMNTGKWLSKNEAYIEDVTPSDTLFRTITGLKSQQQDDIFALKNIKDTEEKVQKEAEREIIKDYHRAIDATANKDYETATTYFANARARMIAAGIPIDRRTELYASASRGYEPQINTAKWNWATKNVPAGQEETRVKALTKQLNISEYRNK